jgi:hypothetical protein
MSIAIDSDQFATGSLLRDGVLRGSVDEVRRSLQRQGAQLKGALWSLRGNPWNLEPDELQTRTRFALGNGIYYPLPIYLAM